MKVMVCVVCPKCKEEIETEADIDVSTLSPRGVV
jgi:hypothetical protein